MQVLTPKVVCFAAREEGIVREAYKDDKDIWTWSMGCATTSGFNVAKYKDNPQTVETCLRAAVLWIKAKFLPSIDAAFGVELPENELAAALSFVWRNGTLTAQWVADFKAGDMEAVQSDWMNWTDHGKEVNRAKHEVDLFCNGVWPDDLRVPVYQVSKPSYKPVRPMLTNIIPILARIL